MFRPFHDLLALYLRDQPSPEKTRSDPAVQKGWAQRRHSIEKAITDTLIATVPSDRRARRDWLHAHPYLHTYLAQHADGSGTEELAALVEDMDFLAMADPVTLTPLLSPTVPELREIARIYRRARPLLGDDLDANAAYLEEANCTLTGTATASEFTGLRPLYRTHLGRVRKDDSLLTLTGHVDGVTSLAFATTANGRLLYSPPAAATGWCGYGTRSPAIPRARLLQVMPPPRRSAPISPASRSLAMAAPPNHHSAGASGGPRWRLAPPETDACCSPLPAEWRGAAVGPDHGRPRQGRSSLAMAAPLNHHGWPSLVDFGVTSVAFGTTGDGRLLLASGSDDGTVRLWDPLTGDPASEALTGHKGG